VDLLDHQVRKETRGKLDNRAHVERLANKAKLENEVMQATKV
jgi:hypothetical protein